jgi:hypothetical protein
MAKAQKNFAEMLDDLINSYFDDADTPLGELRDRVISELELKLMALREETDE